MTSTLPLDREQCLRNAFFITWALIGGVLGYLIIGLVLEPPGIPNIHSLSIDFDGDSVLTLAAILIGIVAMVLSVLVPMLLIRTSLDALIENRKKTPGSQQASYECGLLEAYQSSHIVKLALLEGAAFLNLVSYFQEGKTLCLLLVVLLVGRMLASLPTANKLAGWLDRYENRLRQMA